jgi:DNA-binding MarR family transcriptional regulator
MKQISDEPPSAAAAAAQVTELLAQVIGDAILFNERVAKALGVSAVDLQAFGVISRHEGPTTPTEVTARTGMPASTTTRVLDRLEQAGFIVRSSIPADRRKVAVKVVESKAVEVARHYVGKIEQIRQLNDTRSPAEIAVVVAYLSELAALQ